MQAKAQSSKSKTQTKKIARYSISKGRSMCPHCKHELAAKDLLPVLSWLSLRGKCRYCSQPISRQYPVVELATATLFIASYIFWPTPITATDTLAIGLFLAWLVCLVGFMALVVYDLRWMLLPNRIVFFLYGVAGISVVIKVIQEKSSEPLVGALLGILVGGGIFYALFQISGGRWIGGGDVKLGFVLGALVGTPLQAMLMLFIASSLGCIVSLPLLITGKASRSSHIPFGPFLIVATIIVVLFGASFTDWYLDSLSI